MKRFAFFITALLLAVTVCAQDFPAKPNPPRLVNDYVNFLANDQRAALEKKLVDYYDSTSNEVAIVILESIGNSDPGDYATELLRRWGVGGKSNNNGVIILLTTGGGEGRRHVFITTGYGLEKSIPDYTAKQIVDNDMIPYLKQHDGYRALDNAINSIMQAAAGEYKGKGKQDDGGGGGPSGFIILIIIIIIISFIRRGGGRGGMMSRRGYRGSSIPPIWWFPTGGGGGGGGGWSGGGGGGGFGGFGGGSGGGGGAGGSW